MNNTNQPPQTPSPMKPWKLFLISLASAIGIGLAGYVIVFVLDATGFTEFACASSSNAWCELGMFLTILLGTWVVGTVGLLAGGCIYVAKNEIRRSNWRYWLAAMVVPSLIAIAFLVIFLLEN